MAKRNQRDVARLTLADLNDQQVLAFLDDLEKTHGRTISTRNCRLAALHSFLGFVADRDPLAAGQCAAVLRIPNKRTPKRTAAYLESEELVVLMAQPDRKTKLGERDHVLLAVLYNTGARIAEALNVRLSDIRLDSPAQVCVWGKGRKERISPLWPETVELLVAFLKRNPVGPGEVIFRYRYGNPLGASGVPFGSSGTFRRPRKKFLDSARNGFRRTLCGIRPQFTCLPRASMPPSSGTGWATSAWTQQTFTHKPTWRRNDRPSKRLMACYVRRPHLVGSATPICWHGSTPSEPVAHGQGRYRLNLPVEGEVKLWRAKVILSLCYRQLPLFAAHKYMLRITESLRLREPCVPRGIHTRDNVTETGSFGAGRARTRAFT